MNILEKVVAIETKIEDAQKQSNAMNLKDYLSVKDMIAEIKDEYRICVKERRILENDMLLLETFLDEIRELIATCDNPDLIEQANRELKVLIEKLESLKKD